LSRIPESSTNAETVYISQGLILRKALLKGQTLKFGEFIGSARRLLRVATKPGRDELWLLIKVTLLGVAIVGVIGYIVRVLFWIVGLGP